LPRLFVGGREMAGGTMGDRKAKATEKNRNARPAATINIMMIG